MKNNPFAYVLNSKITAMSFKDIVNKVEEWIAKGMKQKYICVCNTHSLVTAYENEKFNQALLNADICTPDGMPLVWALRSRGYRKQDRVDGPNLMMKLCEEANIKGYKIFLYGGTEDVLTRLKKHLNKNFPNILITGSYSPPFRELTNGEKNEVNDLINAAGSDLIFVSLGCPKQELWMYENNSQINGILLGVGAAFNFIIGDIKRPPILFQKLGLEWFFRLLSEPKRLLKRYIYNNSMYIYYYVKTFKVNKNQTNKAQKNNSYM